MTTKKTKRKKKELNSDRSEEDSKCDEDKECVPEDVEKVKIIENHPHLVFNTAMIKSVLDVIQSSQRKKKSKRYGLKVSDVKKQAKRQWHMD